MLLSGGVNNHADVGQQMIACDRKGCERDWVSATEFICCRAFMFAVVVSLELCWHYEGA
jgi:hypothetical protein